MPRAANNVVGLNVGPAGYWRAIEPTIRALSEALGFDEATTDWIVGDLKRRPLQLAHIDGVNGGPIPAELADLSFKLKEAYQAIMVQWFAEIIRIEGELYRAKTR